eukprot:1537667-Pyramimonas_sp.AAC.1
MSLRMLDTESGAYSVPLDSCNSVVMHCHSYSSREVRIALYNTKLTLLAPGCKCEHGRPFWRS